MSFTYEMEGLGGKSADLSIFGNLTFEQMAKKALNEVRSDVETGTKAALRSSIQHPGDSELVNSVTSYEPVMTRNGEGAKLKCQPTGRSKSGNRYNSRSHGRNTSHAVSNNDKAFWLEYGTVKQPARPWKDRAINNIESKAVDKIEQSIAKELGAE